MKTCTKCKIEKSEGEFGKHKNRKDGLNTWCKACNNSSSRYYHSPAGKEVTKAKEAAKPAKPPSRPGHKVCCTCNTLKEWVDFYKDKTRKDGFSSQCKKCRVLGSQKRYELKRDEILSKQAARYRDDEEFREGQKLNRAEYRKTHKKERREYNIRNRDSINAYQRVYAKQRHSDNIQARIADRLRVRTACAVSRNIKGSPVRIKAGSAVRDLGCSIVELMEYLSKSFYINPETGEEMSWNNWGIKGWQIDHIVPLASFDLTDREQFLRASHYTNLQPLWAKDNWSKNDSVEWRRTA